ncbi:2-amino-4-hydroxy-6-hydroxymethyldihydropteridine diphosphokinase [Acinetobacter sp. ANC 3813]|uniref:2-amino-4-hydroxy-6- hydroxymethyldihydropteridine diphosphokinase n=1 Tax=Acinetobacter sp. ANC 3813 TaxID=1977873 RepID=UPI000A33F93B|nr:2-amino-4-hydroxy-6-hydroxymethyldihydropteridine diphosphokinase [Acinetobacter sp. ANC 3813]OTG89445.1 2-amino-4-hydroxy-6-hydroxymethyldihydropteridine pyrophosphokinase [Acinetobacter sp. ANC 3813]
MNVTETIYALALASNSQPKEHFQSAITQISQLGEFKFSKIYLIPCRDGIGADYWNAACLVRSHLNPDEMMEYLKQMEAASGRIRPSHNIALDVDLIACGISLEQMQFNTKKLPLALDVKIPMLDIWQDAAFEHGCHHFPVVSCD